MDAAKMREFPTRYTAVWCSQDAASVATFFAANGSPKINSGNPSRGREARLAYLGHVLEHRLELIVQATVTPADGHGERGAALVMLEGARGRHRITVAADKSYDSSFINRSEGELLLN